MWHCLFYFSFFYLFYLFPAKTEVCLDSLIPGLEPPQAQLHPVEADPVSSALGGKKYAFETDKPLSSILAPCQILQWLQNICVESWPEAMADFSH